jgi:mannose-6-phosphate isomerase-like protein (cupin superfamily)
MDQISQELLKEILPVEKEVSPPVHRKSRPANAADHWSHPVMLERAAYLRKLARYGEGAESETLQEFPRHSAMLLVRTRDGEAEVHEKFADIFYVLEGRAALETGGTLVKSRQVAPGELRGAAIEGGQRNELRAGDVAHVPAGVPHRMIVASDKPISCLVMKIQQED